MVFQSYKIIFDLQRHFCINILSIKKTTIVHFRCLSFSYKYTPDVSTYAHLSTYIEFLLQTLFDRA